MRKIVVLVCLVIWSDAMATESFLTTRYERNKTRNGETSNASNTTYEANTRLLAFGNKVVVGENDFIIINPHFFVKCSRGFQAGFKYATNSFGGKKCGPAIRYVGPISQNIFMIFDVTKYFDLVNNVDLLDIWVPISQRKSSGFCLGAEIWYTKGENRARNIYLRPLKLSYKFEKGHW